MVKRESGFLGTLGRRAWNLGLSSAASWSLTAVLAAVAFSGPARAQVIATYAGSNGAFTGDGQAATALFLSKVSSVVLDPSGNPVFALRYRNVVLRVNADGSVTRLAGTGDNGSFGNGTQATAAGLNAPQGVGYDSAGNLYIADTGNNRIQKVSAQDGTVTTFAGAGQAGFAGDNALATQARLSAPTAVLVDALNNVYIDDEGNARIRKVTQGVITTYAGNGQSLPFQANQPGPQISLFDPAGIALDRAGSLYIADFAGNRVIKIDATSGLASSIAGTGVAGTPAENAPAASSSLANPGGVAVDSAGAIYVSDTNNFKIRKIAGGIITTYAGNGIAGFSGDGGPATAASLNAAFGMAVDAQFDLFVADRDNFRVRRVTAGAQTIQTIAGNGTAFDNGVPSSSLLLSAPTGVTLTADGSVYIADSATDVVRRVTAAGPSFTVAGTGAHGYGGDNGLATSAELSTPLGTAFDSAGNLYIADSSNALIRKVDASGVITTVAGNGKQGYNGDSISATQASFSVPAAVAFDAAGSMYIADFGNNRIRRVSNGVVTTVAGTGQAGSADGPALSATLNGPVGLAFDAKGDLLIADAGNGRVRSLSTTGMLTTIAGGGSTPFPASNGGAATSAALGGVYGVAADSFGNIYLSDATNEVVQKISGGRLTTIAGSGKQGFAGDGGNATAAQLNTPFQLAVDPAGDVFIADSGNNRVRIVYAAPPSFQATPDPLQFSAASGGLSVSQSLSLNTAVAGLPFSVSVQPGASWLSVTPPSGQMPATVTVTADPSQLQQSPSDSAIIITSPFSATPTLSIPVHFAVGAAQPSKLSPEATQLSFSFPLQGAPVTRPLQIRNAGGGTLAFGITTATGDGGNWLRVSAANGTATADGAFSLGVTADPTKLLPGTYTGTVALKNNNATDAASIAITVTVSSVAQTMALSQSGFTFNAVQGGGAAPAQTFEVVNNGQGTLNWTLTAAPLDNGLNWFSVSASSGASVGGVTPAPVTVTVNPGGLGPGVYYGLITVQSPNAKNSPQLATVVLNLLPPGQDPGPVTLPSGLIFTGIAGGPNPAPQTVTVSNLSASSLTMGSSRTFVGAAGWFVHDPVNATLTPSSPLTITVTPQAAGLLPGVYEGALSLAFSDGSLQTVAIRLVLAPGGLSSGIASSAARQPEVTTAGCVATKLVPLFTTLEQSFSLPAAWPQQIIVKVVDDCGNPLTSGSVVVEFSSDRPLSLGSLQDGRWEGTWTPVNVSASMVLTATAQTPQTSPPVLQGVVTALGGIQNNPTPPLITLDGIISITNASPGAPLSPGEFISIYGLQLADSTATAPELPFETSLQGVRVQLGGQYLPLQFTSGGQLNAVIPYGLATNVAQDLVVQRGNQTSSVVHVPMADSMPTIFFTLDASGADQGGITDPNGVVYDASNPASAGAAAVIYCTGLGAVDNSSVAAGAAAPANPAANSVSGPLSVTIGGQPVQQILFSGLTPGYTGVYQINVIIPGGLPPGPVPVVVTVAGRPSSPVTITVQ